jgi:hypothetical protein
MQPAYRSARSAPSRAARFSSKSSLRCSACRNAHHLTFALGGKRQTSADVITRQLRKIGQYLLLTHAGGKVREHVTDGNARPPNAWLPEPHFGLYDDPILIIHCRIRCQPAWLGPATRVGQSGGTPAGLFGALRFDGAAARPVRPDCSAGPSARSVIAVDRGTRRSTTSSCCHRRHQQRGRPCPCGFRVEASHRALGRDISGVAGRTRARSGRHGAATHRSANCAIAAIEIMPPAVGPYVLV